MYFRTPARSKGPGKSRIATVQTLPAPIGGWNTRDALPVMDPKFASVMDNFFPDSDGVKLRGGSQLQSAITSEIPKRLAALEAGAVSKLVAFSETKIWDASVAVPVQIGSGFSTFDWDTAVIDNRLIMANGVDHEQGYDGTTLSALAFTGGPAGHFIGCLNFAGRAYYWQAGSSSFWYCTAAGTFQGALGQFDLSTVTTAGGSIVAMQSWSVYGGDQTASDLLAIFFTSGEVLIYAGTDPGSIDPATAFTKQSQFHLAPLLGRHMALKFGGDVIMGTIDGYFPLSKAIALGALTDQISISDNIQPSIRKAAVAASGSPYWRGVLYSFGNVDGAGGMLIFNAPANYTAGGAEIMYQHVMNTRTGAWCRFQGLNGYDWTIWKNRPFFCAVGGVYEFNVGTGDVAAAATTPISGIALQAYSDLGFPGVDKKVNGVRPIVLSDGPIPIGIGIAVDYAGFPITNTTTSSVVAGPDWNVTAWDVADWGLGASIQKSWQHAPADGEMLALGVSIRTSSQAVTWYASKFLVETGTVLGIS